MIECLACRVVYFDRTCDWVSRLIMFSHILNYDLTWLIPSLDQTELVPFVWLDLISFSILIRLDQVWFFELISLTKFNYFDCTVLPFNFRVEYSKRCYQSHSGEYYLLDPYPTQNTWGRYIPIFPVFLITPTRAGPEWIFIRTSVGITLSTFCTGAIIVCICSDVHSATLIPTIRGIWTPYGYHILEFYNLYLITCISSHMKKITS